MKKENIKIKDKRVCYLCGGKFDEDVTILTKSETMVTTQENIKALPIQQVIYIVEKKTLFQC